MIVVELAFMHGKLPYSGDSVDMLDTYMHDRDEVGLFEASCPRRRVDSSPRQ
jgi:hypothetical protein